jgi:hypothetical protein
MSRHIAGTLSRHSTHRTRPTSAEGAAAPSVLTRVIACGSGWSASDGASEISTSRVPPWKFAARERTRAELPRTDGETPMQTVESVRGARRAPEVSRIPTFALGLSLSLFLALSFVLCVLLGLAFPDFGLHQPWLQFLPGFTWLTWPSFFLGLIESTAYGWYVALIFGPLYNLLAARAGESLAVRRR